MTEERKAIVRGVINAVRVFNKVWKKNEQEDKLVVFFGQEENITTEEVNEVIKEMS
jgi:hypothetical protein